MIYLVLPLPFGFVLVYRDCYDTFEKAGSVRDGQFSNYPGFEIWDEVHLQAVPQDAIITFPFKAC